MRLKDKVSIITGGSSGINRGICTLFAREGSKVVVVDIDEKGGQETVNIIIENGGDALFVKTDVTNEEQVESMVKTAVDKYGNIDVLVNGVGNWAIEAPYVGGDTPSIIVEPVQIYQQTMDINFKSLFLCTKFVMAKMWKSGKGSILNISSTSGLKGDEWFTYDAAKAAVVHATRSLAIQGTLDGRQIRSNCIVPGDTETPQSLSIDYSRCKASFGTQLIKGKGAGGSLIPEDIAYCALYLASDESSLVTGVVIPVDGGLSL